MSLATGFATMSHSFSAVEDFKPLGMFEPEIHFTYTAVERWRKTGLTIADVGRLLDELWQNVRGATGYRWANQHNFIDDISGHPGISFAIHGDAFCMWEANHGRSMGDLTELPDQNTLYAWLTNISEDKVQCNKCGGWFGDGEWRHYSFAGAVCNADYDPKVHKPPDTRGD